MGNLKISQVLMLTLIATLLFLTPLLPSSVKSPYLFFIMNILIVALGVDAGLLSSSPKSPEEKNPVAVTLKSIPPSDTSAEKEFQATDKDGILSPETNTQMKAKAIEKFASGKTTIGVARISIIVKKCPSSPSLFFIGDEYSYDAEEDCIYDQEEEELGGLSGQELCVKAETFIRNFYKQLKMQREESWRRISDIDEKQYY